MNMTLRLLNEFLSRRAEKMKTHELLITDEIFTGLRQDFNMMMRKTLNTMQSKGSDGGENKFKT